MIGFYILLVLGGCIFFLINVYAVAQNLFTSVSSTVVFELIFLWVCIGPQLVLYYILKLKTSINSYKYLYEAYENTKKQLDDLHFENVSSKKKYEADKENLQNVPYKIIEKQKEVIKELTKQRDRYKEEYIILKKDYLEKTRRDGKNFEEK